MHREFIFGYNNNRIITVNMSLSDLKQIRAYQYIFFFNNRSYDFTYSVKWIEVDTPFNKRYEKYLDYHFFEHQIHWISILNSVMIVIFLCGLVITILLRTLERDIAKVIKNINLSLQWKRKA